MERARLITLIKRDMCLSDNNYFVSSVIGSHTYVDHQTLEDAREHHGGGSLYVEMFPGNPGDPDTWMICDHDGVIIAIILRADDHYYEYAMQ